MLWPLSLIDLIKEGEVPVAFAPITSSRLTLSNPRSLYSFITEGVMSCAFKETSSSAFVAGLYESKDDYSRGLGY